MRSSDDAGGIALDNHGTVIGNIDIDFDVAEKDVIVNHGKIKGDGLPRRRQ